MAIRALLDHARRPSAPAVGAGGERDSLSVREVQMALMRRIEWLGNPSLRAQVTVTRDGGTIVGVIVDGGGRLLQRLEVDCTTGKVSNTLSPEDAIIRIAH